MEADKIKKKLNGSILKGRKFKVESARPPKRPADETDVTPNDKPSATKKSKKHTADENVLDGYELPSDRKVKRGWTESSDDKTERRKKEKKSKDKEKKTKTQLKSKYTEKPECLFRTKVPPNKSATADEKVKKQLKKKNKAAPEAVVHEFSQTMTHPTFLRADDSGKAVTVGYEEGKGWADESGNLKEPASERVRKYQYRPGQIAGHKEKAKKAKVKSTVPGQSKATESEDWTSSSGSSSESVTDSESEDSASSTSSEVSEAFGPAKEPQQNVTSEPETRVESEPSPKGKSNEAALQQVSTEVHPLEALFKKPADQPKLDTEPPAQFSFFGQGDTDSEEEDAAPSTIAPLTPFTKRDLQDRGLRSAAPTPDTSQVAKIINWNTPDHLKNADGEDYSFADSPVFKPGAGRATEESDFAKWFWENRGDNNRAWKKRRRDAAKEQRQRENRRKGMKGKS